MTDTAAARWAEQLAAWAIPAEIREQAPADPWAIPAGLLRPEPGPPPDLPAHRLAREALPDGGVVLDVGCGAGRASLALAPIASRVIGVDRSPDMLHAFAEAAAALGLGHEVVEGSWPEVAGRVPVADVAVSHHVGYNVPDLAGFALALDRHARWRVVLALTATHPMTWLTPLWQRFWDLDRPAGPTAHDARAVLTEAGLTVQLETTDDTAHRGLLALDPAERAALVRTWLCLPPERDGEVAEALAGLDLGAPRRLATIWWDTARQPESAGAT